MPLANTKWSQTDSFVLEKSIFSNIFEKDIRRVFIYQKAERLSRVIQLITPAFQNTPAMKARIDAIAVGLVDSAILPTTEVRTALSRELLALSSILSIARTGNILSAMNADIIAREAHGLLQEVASYEEPNLMIEDAPSLPDIARRAGKVSVQNKKGTHQESVIKGAVSEGRKKISAGSPRKESIVEILKDKGQSSIKDISTRLRGVSEKTIQRELHALVKDGRVNKTGERRWSRYEMV